MPFPLSLSTDVDSTPARGYGPTLRFSRCQDTRRHNPHVDAAWWPRSANLKAELGHLLRVAQESGFQATTVAYRMDNEWAAPADLVAFGGRMVKVSGYHNHHPNMITLIDGISHERMQVMVVPSSTPPLLARRALKVAALHADPIQGTDLLALVCGEHLGLTG